MAQTEPTDAAPEVSATANFNTTATEATPAVITGMTQTPPAGTYIAMFSGIGSNTNGGNNHTFSIFSAGVQVAHSVRQVQPGGNQFANTDIPWYTQAKVTVNGSQAVDVRVGAAGGTTNVEQRSLILLKVED